MDDILDSIKKAMQNADKVTVVKAKPSHDESQKALEDACQAIKDNKPSEAASALKAAITIIHSEECEGCGGADPEMDD